MSKKKNRRTRTPEVFQTEACECGAASLSMIMRYYGCYVPMEEIRFECGINRDGCTAADLVQAGKKFGMRGTGYQVPLENLSKCPKPCVMHWNFDHFVVLEKVTKKYAYINDPAAGHRKVKMDELDKSYTGIILTFTPVEGFRKQKQKSSFITTFRNRASLERGGLLFMLLAGIIITVPSIMASVLSQLFVDNLAAKDTGYLFQLIVAMALVFGLQVLFTTLRAFVLALLQTKISAISANSLFQRMMQLPVQFYEQRYSGELSRRMETNSEVNLFFAGKFTEAILNILTAVVYLIVLFAYSRVLTLIGVVGTAISILISVLLLRPIEELNMQQIQTSCRMSGVLCAGISASSSMKASGVENDYSAEIIGHYARTTQSERKLGFTQHLVSAIPGSVTNIVTVVIMVVGAYYAIRGDFTIGMLTAFIQMLSCFVAPVNSLISFSQSIQQMKASLGKVEDIEAATLDKSFQPNENREQSSLKKKLSGRFEVNNLLFGYNPSKPPVLDDFSFSAGAGSRIAIVGTSGCGKSTVAKLMAGLLTPWGGEVKFDDIPVGDIPREWLCGSVAYIGQNGSLFHGTVRENISLWKNEYPESMLISAAADADAEELINSLPGSYDYLLDEGGKNLSGGQRQKMEIARALMINPTILIMDEATSALDAESEEKIMANIRKRGCTCVIIAHRLSSVRDCDMIIVMDNGKVAEAGTHNQLMAKGGLYRNLVENY